MLLLASVAHAALVLRGEAVVAGTLPVPLDIVVSPDREEAGHATTFADPTGARWEVLVDADDLGQNALVALQLRVHDARGRHVGTYNPWLLVQYGQEAVVRVGDLGPGGDGYSVRLTVEREDDATAAPDTATPLPIRRTFFADKRRDTYTFYLQRPGWTGLSCDGGVGVREGGQGQLVGVVGRKRPGQRVEGTCHAETPEGPVDVPVVVAFL